MFTFASRRFVTRSASTLLVVFALGAAFFAGTTDQRKVTCHPIGCTEAQREVLAEAFGLDRNYLEVTRDNLRDDNKWLLGIPILLAIIAFDSAIVRSDRRRSVPSP